MTLAPKAFVIGWPIDHSRSPLIHGFWLQHLGLAGSYEKVAVAPENLSDFVITMRERGFVGGNVTIPHKEAIVGLCDRLTPAAARLGAVNTVWFEGDALVGDTTDGIGFLSALDQDAPGWDIEAGVAVVIGAGGAARAIVAALQQRGFKSIMVASRTASRAKALARRFDCVWCEMDLMQDGLAGSDLLVNTSPAGMKGQPALDLDLGELKPGAVVNDIVYVPRETPLLLRARMHDLRIVGGIGMLLHQAAPGFERWFGVRPEVTPALRTLVEADIAAR